MTDDRTRLAADRGLGDLSAAQLREELFERPREARAELPGMEVIERPGWWQLITPSVRDGGLNEVALSILAEDEADAVIDRALADYRDRGIRFRWSVFPSARPLDLAARLEARGLRREETAAVARETATAAELEAPAGVEVQAIEAAEIDRFVEVMARGWGSAPGPLLDYHRRAALRDDHRFYLARVGDGPWAAAAGAVLFPRSVFLLGGVVLPEARGAGLYRALVRARLLDAAARGITVATSHAIAKTSAPILTRLGFVEVARFAMLMG
ncbi:MAG: hypothetical protein R3A79_20755 [Nannocystaceae bacterium]